MKNGKKGRIGEKKGIKNEKGRRNRRKRKRRRRRIIMERGDEQKCRKWERRMKEKKR